MDVIVRRVEVQVPGNTRLGSTRLGSTRLGNDAGPGNDWVGPASAVS